MWLRNMIFQGIPKHIRSALSTGVVFWVVLIGLTNGNLINYRPPSQSDLVDLVDFSDIHLGNPATCGLVCLFTFLLILLLKVYHFDNALLIAIFFGTLFAIPLKVADVEILKGIFFLEILGECEKVLFF